MSAGVDNAPLTREQVERTFERHGDVLLAEVGEGESMLVLGHPDEERAAAAVTAYTGTTLDDWQVERAWAVFTPHSPACVDEGQCVNSCADEWAWWVDALTDAPAPGALAVTRFVP